MEIIMATSNANKIREIREILDGTDIRVYSLTDIGIEADIDESGETFEENAVIKAEAIRKLIADKRNEAIVVADDSGLEIDYLGGEPGVHSARYMEEFPYTVRNQNLIDRLQGVPDEERTARFVCAMAIARPCGETLVFRGEFQGMIAHEPAGENGFGYDPILYLPERGCTSAQLSPEEKNAISHRGIVLRTVISELKKIRQE
ncbi:MAG: RdgB/HAM1 family non-canonical purine NTP pyrophosphatase [Lachnospiraceae bacterium]|jgi:XTP/dITP diphosphohydrolase